MLVEPEHCNLCLVNLIINSVNGNKKIGIMVILVLWNLLIIDWKTWWIMCYFQILFKIQKLYILIKLEYLFCKTG